MRCLIVDDSPDFLAAARRLLEREGVTVAGVASDSAGALRSVEDLRPEVVLVDIDLGGESGLELVGKLDRTPAGGESRIIVISTHAEEDYHDVIAAGPAAGFLSKSSLSARAIHQLLER
ncbi:response regulator transcription factor [Amycolatopsis sp. FDAARGOS 1241]|uniref:response regulator n=1 Tax=Amycolatopsis sp. FDAARGOS 1241 TaxID=2778070 RepID=UPI001EF248CC|nr:response regulator transcription factor [Amycolatopsis sp. FDAARGOS 1241]